MISAISFRLASRYTDPRMKPHPGSQPIFLVGVKNTGKSVLAPLVAAHSNRVSVDTDAEVVRLHADETGRRDTVRAIFRSDGGVTFRRLEAIACTAAACSRERLVVATGGGLCDNPDAIAALTSGLIVALESDADLLFNRIMKRGIPAFLSARSRSEARGEFMELYQRRSELYRAMAHIRMQVGIRRPEEDAAELAERIEEYIHARQ